MGKIHQGSRWLVLVGVVAAVVASLAIWWVSPSQRLKRQVNALIATAISGDAKAVATALAGGVDVNSRDARGITVLMHAARGDRPKIADPTPTDHPEVVELLISAFCWEENKLTRIGSRSRTLPRPARPGPGRSLGGRLGSVCLIALRPRWKGRYIIL
jgi:hypothetical protein